MLLGVTAFLGAFWLSSPLINLVNPHVCIYIGEYGYMRYGGDNRQCIYNGIVGMVLNGVSVGEVGETDRIASISCS